MSNAELLKKRIERERLARKQAEEILEKKSLELYEANEKLHALNLSLEKTVEARTKELAQSQKQFQSLVESVGDIIYNINSDGHFTYINPSVERILGYRVIDLIGKHFTELIPDKDRNKVSNFYEEQLLSRDKTSYLEFQVVTKSGELIWVGQQVEIYFPADESEPRITAVTRDINQLVLARKALTSSEKKYRSMIEGLELGLLEVDTKGIITNANQVFCNIMGYSKDELIAKDPVKLFSKPQDFEKINIEAEDRAQGKSGVYELELIKKNGQSVWMIISGAPFYSSNGEIIGSVGIHLDITNQKLLQRQLELAKTTAEKAQLAEKEFLAKMSHEIRTPLNAVVGMANLLHTTSLNDIQEEYVDDIKYAADVLMGLISDVLDISKIDAGELTLNESEFDLRESLNALVRTLDYKARENDNELVVFMDHQVPELILADKNVINQILLNLIGNALKFTTKGTISINVNVLNDGEENSQLQFEIIDTGKGIEPEKLATVFEKYQQENKAIKSEYGGTGLGLSICKELVELHGGKIWAESEVGEGSTFIFTVKVAALIGVKGEGNEEVIDYNNQLGGKILVVEDSYLNLKYLLTLLNSWDVDYDVAYDGEEAVKLCAKEQYQLIFMDMQMPKMNGYDATKNIRNFSVLNSETPIVALTASALLEDQRAAEDAGVNSHLIKPFSPGQLKRVIVQYANYQDKNGKKKTSKQGKFNDEEWQVLSEYFDGDTEHALIVVESFMSSNKENMKLMADYLDNNEFDSVTSLMHKCKPSLAMVGLRELSILAAEIESLLKSNKNTKAIELIHDFLPKLNKDLPRVEQFYQKLKNE